MMNLPNKLTIMRVILIPFFVFFFLLDAVPGYSRWISFWIFGIASLTDMLDGYIARKYNLITNFGKLMDPLADKLLVTAALIVLTVEGSLPSPITIIIISREFIVSGLRQLAADRGIIIAAGNIGKLKTICQLIMTLLMIARIPFFSLLEQVFMWLALILTLISMLDYLVKNKQVIME